MIPTFCISKDRPAQLDLLLNSINRNSPDLFDITVVRHASNNEYYRGYKILEKLWPEVNFLAEVNCNDDFYSWLDKNKHPLTAFFTDDCIFYRENYVLEEELLQIFSMQNMWTFTYRLGNNITIQDYTCGNSTNRPRMFVEKGNSIYWDYRTAKADHSFGWPVGLDGYVWRTKDLKNLLDNENFGHFTKLEGLMLRKFQQNQPYQYLMSSPLNSNVVVEQINVTHGDKHWNINRFTPSLQELNNNFINGKRIVLESMDFSSVSCTHGEIPFIME